MTIRRELAGHLRLYADMGVSGVSRDAAWRERTAASAPVEDPTPEPVSEDLPAIEVPVSEAVPMVTSSDPAAALVELRAFIGDCTRCKLHTLGRTQVVFGVGNPQAKLMFVGEAPGSDEDQQGEPFVGRAGQLLTRIIEGGLEMKRGDVYIANVIKCRPPGNRNPEPDEVSTCEPFLFQQIDAIRPRVIVALGKFAAQTLLRTDAPISRIRGVVHDYRGGAKLIPTFHPAFLLRSPEHKREVWEDMKKVLAILAEDD